MPILIQSQSAPLKTLCYYGTGGLAPVIIPQSIEELTYFLKSRNPQKPLGLLGLGSNSLVGDESYPGDFILFKNLNYIIHNGTTLTVGAGVENSTLSQFAQNVGLDGVDWMYRLPGQMGATTRMNARCYGGEISKIVTQVKTLTPQGQLCTYQDPMVFRGYKDTLFMQLPDLIVEVTIKLKEAPQPELTLKRMGVFEADRIAKGQFDAPSCGCVFKNDYSIGVPSGKLLDTAGAKGLTRGGAEVGARHANFIFNRNNATARDVLELSFQLQDLVYDHFGVWLQYEMELLGEFSEELKQRYKLRRPSQPIHKNIEPLRMEFNLQKSVFESNS